MGYVEIHGGKPLSGSVRIQGSKNAVLPILAGCILHEGVSRIAYCPRIRDVFDMIELLKILGCRVWWEGDCLAVDAVSVSEWRIPRSIASRMRSSVLFLGALLGRLGRACLPYPGGCVLGARPVDLHVNAMRHLGASVEETEGSILAEAGKLEGTTVMLRFPSVGATENIILAAVRANGVTEIHNAAREPEIGQLCSFLREKGADIRELPGGRIRIAGVTKLGDSRHELAPDRIVAGTYVLAAAVTESCIRVERMPGEHLEAFTVLLERMGICFEKENTDWIVDSRGARRSVALLETAPYPGFPTDLQSPMMTLLAVTEGESRIRENIFEARFKTARELAAMGADISIHGNEAVIRGVPALRGNCVEAEELRGAAALILAGLNAEGVTRIEGYEYIGRGYENIFENLETLGADIEVCG